MKRWESTLKQCSMRQIQETAYWFLLFNLYFETTEGGGGGEAGREL